MRDLEIYQWREGETQRQTEVPRFLFLPRLKGALDELKLSIRQIRGEPGEVIFMLTQLMRTISMVEMELKQITFISPSEGKTELRQNDELARFLQSTMVPVESMQENLTQLIERNPEWFVKQEEKEKKNFQENV